VNIRLKKEELELILKHLDTEECNLFSDLERFKAQERQYDVEETEKDIKTLASLTDKLRKAFRRLK